MSGLDLSKCVICQCDTQESLIQMIEKGLASVIRLLDSPGPYLTHSTCRKRFTDLRNLRLTGDTNDVPVKRLRSSDDLFDWKRKRFGNYAD